MNERNCGSLEQKVNDLAEQVKEQQKEIDELTALANKAKGGIGLFLVIVGSAAAVLAFLKDLIKSLINSN